MEASDRSGRSGDGGLDEIAHLKHQVFSLAAKEGATYSKVDYDDDDGLGPALPEPHRKKSGMQQFWQVTSAATPSPQIGAKPSALVDSASHRTSAAAKFNPTMSASGAHHYTPALALPSPPLGRPPDRPPLLIDRPASYSTAAAGGNDSVRRGEKWNPSTEVRSGSVARLKSQFPGGEKHEISHPGAPKQGEIHSGSVARYKQQFGAPQGHAEAKHMWTPQDDIDPQRIDGIKAMWGRKAGAGAMPAPPMGPPPPQPSRRKVDTSRFESPGNSADALSGDALDGSYGSRGRAAAGGAVVTGAVATAAVVAGGAGAAVGAERVDEADAEAGRQPETEEAGSSRARDTAGEDFVAISIDEDDDEEEEEEDNVGGDDDGEGGDDYNDDPLKREIVALVAEVLPDEMDNVDDLLVQFAGREEKLRDTLENMKARSTATDDDEEEEEEEEDLEENKDEDDEERTVPTVGAAVVVAAEPDSLDPPKAAAGNYANRLRAAGAVGDAKVAPGSEPALVPGDENGSISSDEQRPTPALNGTASAEAQKQAEETPFLKSFKGRACVVCAVVVLAICGTLLGLFFSGVILGANEEGGAEKAVEPVAMPVNPNPTARPSLPPAAEEAAVVPVLSACELSVANPFDSIELGESNNYPPNVAIDGDNAVAVTSSGDVLFYELLRTPTGERRWDELWRFTNANRQRGTPPVVLSGNIAVVGFLYHVLGDQGAGGPRVYERDESTGRWMPMDDLVPKGGVGVGARYGWSVDVDASGPIPRIVVGAYGENSKRGSVYVFERRQKGWIEAGMLTPVDCPNGLFGYTVAVHGDLIAATTDCRNIVQVFKYNRSDGGFDNVQNIRYVSRELGEVASLVMDDSHLAYSTVNGGVVLMGRVEEGTFEFGKQLDYSSKEELTSYPLALDGDVLVVGVGNTYKVRSLYGSSLDDGSFDIGNQMSQMGSPSVAVSGRNVLVGSASPHAVYHYDIQQCMGPMTTLSPTKSPAPTKPLPMTLSPTLRPTTEKPSSNPTFSSVFVESPTPPLPPPPTSQPSSSPSRKPTSPPSVSPTKQVATTRPTLSPSPPPTSSPSPPPSAASAEAGCYPVEIEVLFDSSPIGTGYVLTEISANGAETSVATFFPFDDSLVNESHTESLCLERGQYKFTMYDSLGNGLCCANGEGGYAVTNNGVILAEGAEFGFNEATIFDLPV